MLFFKNWVLVFSFMYLVSVNPMDRSLLLKSKIQQTKMLVTCQRVGDLFLFELVLQYSSTQKKYNKSRFKVMATYLQQ